MDPENDDNQVPENDAIDENLLDEGGSGVDEAENESLEDVLGQELEDLRADEDSEGGDNVAAQDGEPGDGDDDGSEGDQEGDQATASPDGGAAPADQEADGEVDPDAELLSGMKERTRERFTEMRTNLKAAEDRITEFQGGVGELHNVVMESTATAQQLSGALQIFKMINAGDAQGASSALPELQALYNAVAQVAGVAEMGGDPLANHPDLKQGVDDLNLTQENAEEMARLRLQQNQSQQRVQKTQQAEQTQQANQLQAQNAANGIKQWEDNLITSDADYKLLQPSLVQASQAIMQQFPPHEWLPRIQHEYKSMHEGLALANKAQQKGSPAPVRPGPSGGSTKPDTSKMSMEQLLESNLATMRG